ncbi:MAG: regulatory iron-sulfur-containing complex subunit RicT [Patescibacteria group bacterium]|jgi:cell fate regulator YaaT (PSP1 superfamily)
MQEETQKVVEANVHSWEKNYFLDPADFNIKRDDWVIFTSAVGGEAGKVVGVHTLKKKDVVEPLTPVERTANLEDLKKIKEQQENRKDAMKVCKQFIRKNSLPMKLVDCNYTFDGKKIVFAFTAESRVDFRDLVKDLSTHYKKVIRLQQIGIRDELKNIGGIGPCGRGVCCANFLKELGNITTDLARLQQVQQRGSDRLSGACGRLKCCLNYEAEGYRACSQDLPPLDSMIQTEQGKGRVIDWNVIKHSVLVRVDDETIVEHYFGCKKCRCSGCAANKYFTKK